MGMLDIFSGNNSNAGSQFAAQQRQLGETYNPQIEAGNTSLAALMEQYNKGISTPDFLQNQLASNWKESPYLKAQQKYMSQVMNNNAAATGNLGSSYGAREFGTTMQDIMSADFDKYLDRGTNAYNNSMSGYQNQNMMGLNSLNQKNNILSGANEAEMKQNQANTGALTGLIGQGLSLGANFATGGASGAGGFIGGMGRSMMPTSFTDRFKSPAITMQPQPQGFNGAGSLNANPNYFTGGTR